jgi:hypothetical protein
MPSPGPLFSALVDYTGTYAGEQGKLVIVPTRRDKHEGFRLATLELIKMRCITSVVLDSGYKTSGYRENRLTPEVDKVDNNE